MTRASINRKKKLAAKPKAALPKANKPLSEYQVAQRDRQGARNRARPERPEANLLKELDGKGGLTLTIQSVKGQDEKLYAAAMFEALGTRSIPFLNDTLDNVMRVLSPSRDVTADQYNAALAIMAAVEPENELEATLASQMVAANDCAMRCMRGMAGSQMTDQHRMYGDLANKFMRTFTAQVEALAKLRRKGEQVVRHVHVHEGGQAVVAGTINQTGGRGSDESSDQSHGAEVFEACAALPSPDAARDGVPVPGNAEREMSHSRRQEPGRA